MNRVFVICSEIHSFSLYKIVLCFICSAFGVNIEILYMPWILFSIMSMECRIWILYDILIIFGLEKNCSKKHSTHIDEWHDLLSNIGDRLCVKYYVKFICLSYCVHIDVKRVLPCLKSMSYYDLCLWILT